MIEVYMCCFDEGDSRDGDMVATFYEWKDAILFVDAYRDSHADEMDRDNWGIMAYNVDDGSCY